MKSSDMSDYLENNFSFSKMIKLQSFCQELSCYLSQVTVLLEFIMQVAQSAEVPMQQLYYYFSAIDTVFQVAEDSKEALLALFYEKNKEEGA